MTYLSTLTKNSAIKYCGPYLTNKETEALRGSPFQMEVRGEKEMKSGLPLISNEPPKSFKAEISISREQAIRLLPSMFNV